MSRIYLAHGASFTGKSRFAGSRTTGRKWYAETDPGSFDRANFPNPKDFEVHRYFKPLKALLDFGTVRLSSNAVLSRNLRKIHGVRELLEEFRDDLLKALESGDFADFIYDTEGLLWDYVEDGFRQEVQEAGRDWDGMSQRDKYTEPNYRMEGYVRAPAMVNCSLILVCHEKEIWANNQPTGSFISDGWKHSLDRSDLSLRFQVQAKQSVATIGKGGAGGFGLSGMVLPEPTLEKADALLDAAKAICDSGLSMPGTFEEVLALGASLE